MKLSITRSLICVLLIACTGPAALAHSTLLGNPDLPYPPGCAGDPGRSVVPFVSNATINLYDSYSKDLLPVQVDMYRATCSEPDRSPIWIRITAFEHSWRHFALEVPQARALLPNGDAPQLSLVTSPNGRGESADAQLNRRILAHYYTPENWHFDNLEWTFLLDNQSEFAAYPEGQISAAAYNGSFVLQLYVPPDGFQAVFAPKEVLGEFAVPATAEMFEPEVGIPFSGRLSGIWTSAGAEDQGFMISISNQVVPYTETKDFGEDDVRDSLPLVLFFAHYTYDGEGRLLWLTGAKFLPQGSKEVELPIEEVTGGKFMGNTVASRKQIGTVKLTANACDDLSLEFDYSALGLGTGSLKLQRLFSLETAGHECRDYTARVAANK